MSFPRYTKYKDSGVKWLGEIPAHWGVVQSRRLFTVRNESATATDKQLTASQEHGVIYQEDFIRLEGRRVVEVIKGTDSLKHVEPDDFVISMRSFQGGIEWSTLRGSISWHYVMLVPVKHVHPPFFAHLFKSLTYIQALRTTTDLIRDGQELRYSHFVQVDLPLVPMEEQAVIASFLSRETSKIDALVLEQERLIELLKKKRQAVISHAVTKGLNPDAPMKPSGVEWLGEVPAHWDVGPLKRYWTVTDCKHVTAEFVDDGIPIASIREVQGRWIDLKDAKCTTTAFYELLIEGGRRPMPGDLIFSRNATVGEVAQVHADHPRFAMGQDVVLLRRASPELSSDYMQQVIRSAAVTQQLALLMIGSTFKRINVEEIRSLVVPSPPVAEQTQIAAFLEGEVERANSLIAEAQRAIDLLQERRTALISAAVTGQIDVRGLADRAAA
jgi:type I restriction enzyme S subunit